MRFMVKFSKNKVMKQYLIVKRSNELNCERYFDFGVKNKTEIKFIQKCYQKLCYKFCFYIFNSLKSYENEIHKLTECQLQIYKKY